MNTRRQSARQRAAPASTPASSNESGVEMRPDASVGLPTPASPGSRALRSEPAGSPADVPAVMPTTAATGALKAATKAIIEELYRRGNEVPEGQKITLLVYGSAAPPKPRKRAKTKAQREEEERMRREGVQVPEPRPEPEGAREAEQFVLLRRENTGTGRAIHYYWDLPQVPAGTMPRSVKSDAAVQAAVQEFLDITLGFEEKKAAARQRAVTQGRDAEAILESKLPKLKSTADEHLLVWQERGGSAGGPFACIDSDGEGGIATVEVGREQSTGSAEERLAQFRAMHAGPIVIDDDDDENDNDNDEESGPSAAPTHDASASSSAAPRTLLHRYKLIDYKTPLPNVRAEVLGCYRWWRIQDLAAGELDSLSEADRKCVLRFSRCGYWFAEYGKVVKDVKRELGVEGLGRGVLLSEEMGA